MPGLTLFVDGTVLTLDPAAPVAEALAVRDGRIAAVGSREAVLRLRSGEHTLVNLAGRTVVPGFIDPHNHEGLPAEAALGAYTMEAARVCGLEAEAGSLEVGKRADLVILDGNPLAVPPEALLGLRVVTTLVAGARSGRRRGRRPELSRRRPL